MQKKRSATPPKPGSCPECGAPGESESRNRLTETSVEYRCPAGHGYFAVREGGRS